MDYATVIYGYSNYTSKNSHMRRECANYHRNTLQWLMLTTYYESGGCDVKK